MTNHYFRSSTPFPWKKFLSLAGIGFLLLYICFSAFILIPFAHHDTAMYFTKFMNSSPPPVSESPLYKYIWINGRPLLATMDHVVYNCIHRVSDFSAIRLGLIFLAAIGVGLLSIFFMEIGFQTIVAFSLSFSIFILPGAIDPYLMAFFQVILPLIFCLLADRVLKTAWPRYLRWGGCFIMLFTGMMTYQANAFFFVFLTAATAMCAPDDLWPSARNMLLRNISILGVAAIIYYLAVRHVLWARYPELAANVTPGYAVKISLQTIWVKTLGLLGNAGPTIFGLWTLPPSKILSFGLMVFCVISLVVFAMIKKTRTGWARLITWFVLFFAVNGVWIASPAGVPMHRILLPASALALFTLFVCLVKWADVLKLKKNGEVVLAVGLAIVGLFSANYIATKNAWNYNMELMFIRSQLAPYMGRDIKRIHVIAPVDNKIGYDGLQTSGDNFNNKTTHFSADTPDLLRAGMVDLPGRPTASFFSCEAPQPICVKVTPPGQILITKSEPGQPIYPSENMILINMNDLIKATGRKVVQ